MIESWLQDRIGLLGITWAFCYGLIGCIPLVGSERSSTYLSAILCVCKYRHVAKFIGREDRGMCVIVEMGMEGASKAP